MGNAVFRGRGLVAPLAAAVGLLVAATGAEAAGGYSLAIGATVLSASNCKFQGAAGSTLAFGSINPSSGANALASVTLVIRCAGSAATAVYSVTANDGLYSTGPEQRRMRNTVTLTEFLPYGLTSPVSGTVPKNVDTNVVISGTITPAQFQSAIAGNFTDTVVLTLAP